MIAIRKLRSSHTIIVPDFEAEPESALKRDRRMITFHGEQSRSCHVLQHESRFTTT